MEALQKFVFENFFLLFAIALLWNVLAVAFMLWKRKRRGLVLPKVSDPNVVFSERFASGSSDKSWMTRMGGASNCLTVIVTRSELVVTTFFPFTAFAGTYDLEHLVPISYISDIALRGKVTDVVFKHRDGSQRKISLRLRNSAGFLQALRGQINSEQGAAGQPATSPRDAD